MKKITMEESMKDKCVGGKCISKGGRNEKNERTSIREIGNEYQDGRKAR